MRLINSTAVSVTVACSLVLGPHPLTRKGVWWSLSDFLVVPSQQSWYWTTQCYVMQPCAQLTDLLVNISIDLAIKMYDPTLRCYHNSRITQWGTAVELMLHPSCHGCFSHITITHYSSHMTNGILLTRHNQKIAQWSSDPFPRERVGSGHESKSCVEIEGYFIRYKNFYHIRAFEVSNRI